MATITATYLNDLGRVRLELLSPTMNVSYRIERSTDGGVTWQQVRGAQNMGTLSTLIVDDFEYTPNIENIYRLLSAGASDLFNRTSGPGGLVLTGAAGGYASTPDTAALDITGDIDVRAVISFDDYSIGTLQTIVSKYLSAGDQRSYWLRVGTTGTLQFIVSLTGAATSTATSTATLYTGGVSDGDLIAVRATRVAATGVVTFFIGSDPILQPDTWVQLGSTASTTSGNIFSGTAQMEVGSINLGVSDRPIGTVSMVQVRNGIDSTVVANPNFAEPVTNTLSFADSTGKTWTVNGSASILGNEQAWGNADTGQTWGYPSALVLRNALYEVVGDVGAIIAPTVTTGWYIRYIPGVWDDTDVSVNVPITEVATDSATYWGVGARIGGVDTSYTGYDLRFAVNTDNSVDVRLVKFAGGSFSFISAAVLVGTVSIGQTWRIRLRAVGTVIEGKAWNISDSEPAGWQVAATDASYASGAVHVRTFKQTGTAITQYFDNFTVNSIPPVIDDTASITPIQEGVWLKSIAYPLFNRELECVDWQELERSSRTAFFDIKGRHEILGIADVGSSASFSLTFISRSKAENRAIVALLTYGGLMLLQPPGDDESEDCPVAYSGIPDGYVMVGDSVQSRTVYGKPIWLWTVQFTRVAPSDAANILPTTITWVQLWDLIGPDGTWETVWATWSTWQELWLTTGNPLTFGEIA